MRTRYDNDGMPGRYPAQHRAPNTYRPYASRHGYVDSDDATPWWRLSPRRAAALVMAASCIVAFNDSLTPEHPVYANTDSATMATAAMIATSELTVDDGKGVAYTTGAYIIPGSPSDESRICVLNPAVVSTRGKTYWLAFGRSDDSDPNSVIAVVGGELPKDAPVSAGDAQWYAQAEAYGVTVDSHQTIIGIGMAKPVYPGESCP